MAKELNEYGKEMKTVKCSNCGKSVKLFYGWANSCVCGAEYNGAGQRLVDRSEWGVATDEQF